MKLLPDNKMSLYQSPGRLLKSKLRWHLETGMTFVDGVGWYLWEREKLIEKGSDMEEGTNNWAW